MYPFGNTYQSQFIPDLYGSSPFDNQDYPFLSDPNYPFWNPLNFPELPPPLPDIPAQPLPAPALLPPPPPPVKVEERLARTREHEEMESSMSCRLGEESEEASPEVKLRQKYGRNINSNIYHHMVKKLGCEPYFLELFQRAKQRGGMRISQKEFFDMLHKKFGKLRTYISLKKMRDLFIGGKSRHPRAPETQQREREFYSLYRILCRVYLRNVHITHVFNGLRIKKQSKVLHVIGASKIADLIS